MGRHRRRTPRWASAVIGIFPARRWLRRDARGRRLIGEPRRARLRPPERHRRHLPCRRLGIEHRRLPRPHARPSTTPARGPGRYPDPWKIMSPGGRMPLALRARSHGPIPGLAPALSRTSVRALTDQHRTTLAYRPATSWNHGGADCLATFRGAAPAVCAMRGAPPPGGPRCASRNNPGHAGEPGRIVI